MLVRTSTRTAPWCVVEGNDKCWARAKVLAKLVNVLCQELDYEPADPLARQERKRKKAKARSAGKAPSDRLVTKKKVTRPAPKPRTT